MWGSSFSQRKDKRLTQHRATNNSSCATRFDEFFSHNFLVFFSSDASRHGKKYNQVPRFMEAARYGSSTAGAVCSDGRARPSILPDTICGSPRAVAS